LLATLDDFHGKMLRPQLLLATSACWPTTATEADQAMHTEETLAAAVEMIHAATLIHDDMIDDAPLRRGQTTAHVEHGNKVAVLLGDLFYTHAFDLVAGLGDVWLCQRLTRATNIVCRGELQQMFARGDAAVTEAEYERIAYGKTGALTEAACELGAWRGDQAQRDAAGAFGRSLGLAFQIIDDVLDFTGEVEKIGKATTSDAARGLMTLPVIYLLEDEQQRLRWAERLHAADAPDQREHEQALAEAVRASDALERCRARAATHVAAAQAALEHLPAGSGRDQLAALGAFIVARDR
jgi:octaprenyl-diphosphate synthase